MVLFLNSLIPVWLGSLEQFISLFNLILCLSGRLEHSRIFSPLRTGILEFADVLLHANSVSFKAGDFGSSSVLLFNLTSNFIFFSFCCSANLVQYPRSWVTVFFSSSFNFFFLALWTGFWFLFCLAGLGWFSLFWSSVLFFSFLMKI